MPVLPTCENLMSNREHDSLASPKNKSQAVRTRDAGFRSVTVGPVW